MADLFSAGEPHDCAPLTERASKVRKNLTVTPLTPPGDVLTLFTDGCCFRKDNGMLTSAYAVLEASGDQYITRYAELLEGKQSAQRAELIAVTKALIYAGNRRVNIYTDSAYVVGAVHVELPVWQRCGFVTSSGRPIVHEKEAKDLLAALLFPEAVAVIKCQGHDKGDSDIAKGNEAADQAAKQAAGYLPKMLMQMAVQDCNLLPSFTRPALVEEHTKCSPEEISVWKEHGAIQAPDGLWQAPDGRPALPLNLTPSIMAQAHTHVGSKQMAKTLRYWWHP
ncbi:MAG: RNase H family protein, partial [Aeromonas sp.]